MKWLITERTVQSYESGASLCFGVGDFKMRSNSAPPNYMFKNNIWGPAPPKKICSVSTVL